MNKTTPTPKENKILRVFWNHHTCQGVTNDRNGYPQVKYKRVQKQTDFKFEEKIDEAVKKAVRQILDQYGEREQAVRQTNSFAEIITHTVTTPKPSTEPQNVTPVTQSCLFAAKQWAETCGEDPRKAKPNW